MTDKTATQNLTRTQSTDDHRKTALYLSILANEVDLKMAAQYANISRSQVPPAAIVRVNTPYAISSLNTMPNVVFDTVALDTAACVDLAANPQVITLTSPGYWMVGGYVEVTGWPGATGELLMWLRAGGSTRTFGFHDGTFGKVSGSGSVLETTDYPLTETCALGATFSGTMPGGLEGSTLVFAELYAFKVRDL